MVRRLAVSLEAEVVYLWATIATRNEMKQESRRDYCHVVLIFEFLSIVRFRGVSYFVLSLVKSTLALHIDILSVS